METIEETKRKVNIQKSIVNKPSNTRTRQNLPKLRKSLSDQRGLRFVVAFTTTYAISGYHH
jgi:hypothetical protein